jgi:hypothetical protein
MKSEDLLTERTRSTNEWFSSALKMEAVYFFETVVPIYRTSLRCYNTNLHSTVGKVIQEKQNMTCAVGGSEKGNKGE